jgi:hypothetical protein
MNKLLAALTAAGAVAAVPAMAADAGPVRFVPPVIPTIQGYAGVGGAFYDGDSSLAASESHAVVAIGGAVNVPLHNGLNLQFESVAGQLRIEEGPDYVWLAYSKGMLHFYMRSPGHALGVYGGWENLAALPVWTIGGEAQAYLGHLTLYGQVTSHNVDTLGETANWWSVRGAAQLFFTDNFLVQVDVRHQFDFAETGESAFTVGGTIEGRHPGRPWSGFGTIRYTNVSGGMGSIVAGFVGLRAHFGNGSLRQQYTTGASMNTLPLL